MRANQDIAEIEKEYAKAIIRLRGEKVVAEDINGVMVEAILYENNLFDLNCNPLHGYEVKRDWTWVALVSGCLSLLLFYLLLN